MVQAVTCNPACFPCPLKPLQASSVPGPCPALELWEASHIGDLGPRHDVLYSGFGVRYMHTDFERVCTCMQIYLCNCAPVRIWICAYAHMYIYTYVCIFMLEFM